MRATIDGAGGLPVSVKTRIGYHQSVVEEWVGHLLEARPAVITLHLRTAKEMSKVDARWDEITKAVPLVKGTGTLLLGNGDVRDLEHADRLVEETGIDGVMFGRAIFGYPWLFNRERSRDSISLDEKLEAMLTHARLYDEIFSGHKSFLLMRKHLLAYANGFRGAREFRLMLQQVNSVADVEAAVAQFRNHYRQAGIGR
ncbi:MAG: tRNA-dihydrouridine synthase [Candidatus Zixiibacteriota bacterium]|nr:MAG: tRNA-dihydrouridine synthase [candidate division Zixibacteria bacterium]